MTGVLYGVGVGPGDAELLTLKAVRILGECDVIGIPAKDAKASAAYRVALEAVPGIERKPILGIEIPMTRDARIREEAYQQGAEKLIAQLKQGKKIAFLNLGDPVIYGTYMRLHERVKNAGYEAKLVSGVPSFCAVAAELGIALGLGKEEIHILPGLYGEETLESCQGTKILMKSGGKIADVKQRLAQLEAEGSCKAYAVTDCGMPTQRVFTEISGLDEEAGYFTTIIVKEIERRKNRDRDDRVG